MSNHSEKSDADGADRAASEAEIDHGGRSELPDGAVPVERYRIEWPEATVATSARLDLRGDAEAFEVRLDLEAREGDELRWTRSWHRRIPRALG